MLCLALELVVLAIVGVIGRLVGGAIEDMVADGTNRGMAMAGSIMGSIAGSTLGAMIGGPAGYFIIAITAFRPPPVATIVSWLIPYGIAGACVGLVVGLIVGLITEVFDVITRATSGSVAVKPNSVSGRVGATIGGILSTLVLLASVFAFWD